MERRSGTRRTSSLCEVRLPSADAFPTVLRYSIYTPCTLTLSLPLSALAEAGCAGAKVRFLQMVMVRCRSRGCRECVFLAESDGSIGTKRFLAGRWSECVGICCFQTVGSASALSERTSRSEAVNLVSATHFHERERVWK